MRVLAAVVLIVWGVIAWTTLRPREIASDWHGWRQTDTQTIALNLTKPEASILRPQIAWGGDGPGYVETELQLYPTIISRIMRVFGPAEWAGQLVSLAAVLAAALVVFAHLSRTQTPVAALMGLAAILAARTSPHLATVVMPDALALLFYVSGWAFFCRYVSSGRLSDLIAYAIVGTLAMLTKPTTAHLGISCFAFVLIARRERLREFRLWLTWALMVGCFAFYLAHAHGLYVEYGNTFGLLVGEDSKVPGLRYLLMPKVVVLTTRLGLTWGVGWVALLALLMLTLRKALTAEHVALAIGNVVVPAIALRYMSDGAGLHYWAPGSLLAATAVAALTTQLLMRRFAYAMVGAFSLLLVIQGQKNFALRRFNRAAFETSADEALVVDTGKAMRRWVQPGDLVVVRSPRLGFDVFWQQAINYHDPRIFYLTGTHGWTLASDEHDLGLLTTAAARGALLFADPVRERNHVLDKWLEQHAELVWAKDGGRIWNLHTGS